MGNEEIIKLLKGEKANNPTKYEQYMEHYKEKYPDFYKKILIPALGELKSEDEVIKESVQKPATPLVNPAETLATEEKPLGSAEVGDIAINGEKEEKKPEKIIPKESTIKRENKGLKIFLIIFAILVVVGGLGAAAYFMFFA